MRPIILIIENDASYAQFLKKTLLDKSNEVILLDSGIEAINKIESKKIDLVLSSFYLKDIRGDEFYQQVHETSPELPIIFLSHEARKDTIKDMISHPNVDYMVKPIVITELMARIEKALEKTQAPTVEDQVRVRELELDLKTFTAKIKDTVIELSPTEFSLLKYLMANKNTVLTRDMILSRIWGYDTEVTTRVVDVYIGYLREKIEQVTQDEYISTVRGFGYSIKD